MRDAGIRLYAVSYDDPEALADFAAAHEITFPLVADPQSNVIRAFGILNTLVPEEEAEYYGMPFPGSYVIDAAGVVTAKFFENNQIFRPAPELLLRAALGDAVAPVDAVPAPVTEVAVRAYLDGPHLVPGLLRDLVVEFTVPEGHHLYGEPVPKGMVATSVSFESDDDLIVRDTVHPPTRPHSLVTGEVLHVYDGTVELRTPITSLGGHGRGNDGTETSYGTGDRTVRGSVRFQSCDDATCSLPRTVNFEVPVAVLPPIIGDFGGPSIRGEKMHGGRHFRRLLARREDPRDDS